MHNSATPLPVLFLSHGSPMYAIESGQTGVALRTYGASLRSSTSLRAVLVLSPHWMAASADVMAAAQPPTWHDFGGFPQALYQLQYPAPGDPALAAQVHARLQAAGVASNLDVQRPLDHGAWVPLMHLLPQADVPVVQLALPHSYGPHEVYALGQALGDLRQQGVLLLGSGSMTHNLREFFSSQPAQHAPAATYVEDFSRWVEAALHHAECERLLAYRTLAPGAARAHPTDEHFLPLFFALGAAGWGEPDGPRPHYLSREVMYSHLAMDSMALA